MRKGAIGFVTMKPLEGLVEWAEGYVKVTSTIQIFTINSDIKWTEESDNYRVM